MSDRESATQTCPRCRRAFYVMADEVGMHDCPGCGPEPDVDEPDVEDEDEDGNEDEDEDEYFEDQEDPDEAE